MGRDSLKKDLEDGWKNRNTTDFFEHLAYEFDWIKFMELRKKKLDKLP